MTGGLDVQIQPKGAILSADDVPGVGQLTVQLSDQQLDELAVLVNEARLNRLGVNEVTVLPGELEEGDVFYTVGSMVQAIEEVSDMLGDPKTRVYLSNGITLTIPNNKKLRVNRAIQ